MRAAPAKPDPASSAPLSLAEAALDKPIDTAGFAIVNTASTAGQVEIPVLISFGRDLVWDQKNGIMVDCHGHVKVRVHPF